MSNKNTIEVNFCLSDGSIKRCKGQVGETLLTVAHNNGLYELEGACEGSLACATCHVIVNPEFFAKYPKLQKISDDEEDMLDLAVGLCSTSRLGCQITLSSELDGITVHIPFAMRNIKN